MNDLLLIVAFSVLLLGSTAWLAWSEHPVARVGRDLYGSAAAWMASAWGVLRATVGAPVRFIGGPIDRWAERRRRERIAELRRLQAMVDSWKARSSSQ